MSKSTKLQIFFEGIFILFISGLVIYTIVCIFWAAENAAKQAKFEQKLKDSTWEIHVMENELLHHRISNLEKQIKGAKLHDQD